jgi:hypothetical protein
VMKVLVGDAVGDRDHHRQMSLSSSARETTHEASGQVEAVDTDSGTAARRAQKG